MQPVISRNSILETLLKTNRPPTEEEKAIIQTSMVPTEAKLKEVQAQISDMAAHINRLKSQVPPETESDLQQLREEEAAILLDLENHLGVLAPIRNIPEDVLREICIACIADEIPTLRHHKTPLPYMLSQISRGMRHIVLTTPVIWARMDIQIRRYHVGTVDIRKSYIGTFDEATYLGLARRVKEWFDRSGRLPLTVFIEDPSRITYTIGSGEAVPQKMLLDALFSYSARWREIHFISSHEYPTPPLFRFIRLTTAAVPILQSATLCLDRLLRSHYLLEVAFLKAPNLRHVSLITPNVPYIPVNWAVLTSFSLDGMIKDLCYTTIELAEIFRETKNLVSCDIVVRRPRSDDNFYLVEVINLPYLKRLRIVQQYYDPALLEAPNPLDHISAPILAELNIDIMLLETSLLNFVRRSPSISKLRAPYWDKDESLMFMTTLLRHCPLLTCLYLWPCSFGLGAQIQTPSHDANLFLRSFVEEGDVGVTCPRLKNFTFTGKLDFSPETLRLFLEGKQSGIAAPNIVPWKKVAIFIENTESMESERTRHILDLVSQKREQGLDVNVSFAGRN